MKLVSQLPSTIRPVLELASYVGHPIVTCLIGAILILLGLVLYTPVTVFGGALIWISLVISTTIKHFVRRSRPITDYVTHMTIPSFSFPSGHTAGSTVAFGVVACQIFDALPPPASYVIASTLLLLSLAVGVSRVYLGAHYPSDVVGGWILGSILLAIFLTLGESL